MARRQRQRDELRELCRSGDVGRAVDLAFQHVAEFGPDEPLLELFEQAVDRTVVPAVVRRRLADLRASVAGQSSISGGAQGAERATRKEND